jgi:hypothetical protein
MSASETSYARSEVKRRRWACSRAGARDPSGLSSLVDLITAVIAASGVGNCSQELDKKDAAEDALLMHHHGLVWDVHAAQSDAK